MKSPPPGRRGDEAAAVVHHLVVPGAQADQVVQVGAAAVDQCWMWCRSTRRDSQPGNRHRPWSRSRAARRMAELGRRRRRPRASTAPPSARSEEVRTAGASVAGASAQAARSALSSTAPSSGGRRNVPDREPSGSAPGPWRRTAWPQRTGPGSPAGPAGPGPPGRAPGPCPRTSGTSTTATPRSWSSPSWPSPAGHRNRPAGPGTGTSPRPGARPARRSAPPAAPAARRPARGRDAATSAGGETAAKIEPGLSISNMYSTIARGSDKAGRSGRGRLRG